MLHQVSYHELKSLMLQYPYAANLRYLMLVKSLFDNKKEYDRNLALASLSSLDRKKLHELVLKYNQTQVMEESFEIAEEFLELKDLSTLQETEDIAPPESEQAKAQAAPLNFVDSDDPVDLLDDALNAAIETAEISNAEKEDKDLPVLEDLLDQEIEPGEQVEDNATEPRGDMVLDEMDVPASDQLNEPSERANGFIEENIAEENDEATPNQSTRPDTPNAAPKDIELELTNGESEEDEIDKPSTPTPSPKEVFESWKNQSQEPKSGILDQEIDQIENKTKKSKLNIEEYEEPADVANDVASNSLLEDNSIVTETLAGILARQGHNEKAIEMYKKLSLQYPEKSSFFAGKIEKLKKK